MKLEDVLNRLSKYVQKSFGPIDHITPSKDTPSGWWLTYPFEKYDFVSWDDYPIYYGQHTMFQTTNQ
jgi:hypothetical protein